MNVIRRMALAGSWYPYTGEAIQKKMNKFLNDNKFGPAERYDSSKMSERSIIGGVSPHAGMDYSGPCAIHTYLNIFKEKIPDTFIILGFDHRQIVKDSLLEEGEWETPLGNLPIDNELADKILKISNVIVADKSAFIGRDENSLELQMPFIKFFAGKNNVKIVPVKISSHDYKTIDLISGDIAQVIKSSKKDIIVVASSDLYHENVNDKEDLRKFKEKDEKVIEDFVNLKPENILSLGRRASVCGQHTISTLLQISNKLGAKEGKLLKHYTSAEITQKFGYCVGYFSGIIYK
ncbi:MAG: AmmeMemoRadiSam system protein B [Candidatus Lokiarchaeota archaeon]|nr:AmmeMemoRadiSam system protein B [Candidatus Lokiarchaeota archaeon]